MQRFGMQRFGMQRFGMQRFGMQRFGMQRFGMQRFGVLQVSLFGVALAVAAFTGEALAGPKPAEQAVHGKQAAGGEHTKQGTPAKGATEPAAKGQGGAEEGQAVGDPGAAESEEELAGPWEPGPKKVVLGNEVTVDLPPGYAFLPPEPSKKLLELNGSFDNEGVLGLFASTDPKDNWFVVSSYDDSGFVKDDEELDGDDILSELQDGLEGANEERQQHGFKPLALDGWAEPPRYDRAQHQLVWALIVSDADGKSVNLNTRILGRRGYISLNLVTDPATLAADRHHATTLLSVTKFDDGARYEDFNEESDKVAEYGLAGLVMAGAGLGAAKFVKLGLLAKFSKVILAALIAGKKFIILGAAALFALLRKFFTGRKAEPPSAS
jgi:uncharacterized membrane-anchored protein